MIKDKTITKTGWEILVEKLNDDIETLTEELECRTSPSRMDEDNYSCKDDMYEDKITYYCLEQDLLTTKSILKYINEGGK